MEAAVHELHRRIDQQDAPGWEAMLYEYGSVERCLSGYIRATARKGQLNVAAAQELVLETLAFRDEHCLDRAETEVLCAVEAAACRSFWPYGFADAALDGSPVEYCRLSRLNVPRILSSFEEDEVVLFFCLWCEHTLRLLGASVRGGATARGSYHVYDCRNVRWSQLLYDAREHWATVSRVFTVGGSYWPDIAARYFVIHAPYMAT
eukprot:590020-Prymnesium_polylepis.1